MSSDASEFSEECESRKLHAWLHNDFIEHPLSALQCLIKIKLAYDGTLTKEHAMPLSYCLREKSAVEYCTARLVRFHGLRNLN